MTSLCEMYTCTNRVTVPTVGWPGLCLTCAQQQHKEYTKLMQSIWSRNSVRSALVTTKATVTPIHRSK